MSNNTFSPNILIIVDDSSFDLKINSRIAVHANLFKKILCFSSAIEVIDFMVDNINNPEVFPQFILLDIQMPEMDGFEFLNEFAKLPESLKQQCVIVMLSSTDDIRDIARAEANEYVYKLLKKPLLINELKKLVAHHYPGAGCVSN